MHYRSRCVYDGNVTNTQDSPTATESVNSDTPTTTGIMWGSPPPNAKIIAPGPSRQQLRRAMADHPGEWLLWAAKSHASNASNLRFRLPQLEVATVALSELSPNGRPYVAIYTRQRSDG